MSTWVVHPHVGRLLIEQLTNYPAAIGRAIGEHHERMDGSGYPHALRRDALSPLGRLLAVTEAALGVLRSDRPDVARVSVALDATDAAEVESVQDELFHRLRSIERATLRRARHRPLTAPPAQRPLSGYCGSV